MKSTTPLHGVGNVKAQNSRCLLPKFFINASKHGRSQFNHFRVYSRSEVELYQYQFIRASLVLSQNVLLASIDRSRIVYFVEERYTVT